MRRYVGAFLLVAAAWLVAIPPAWPSGWTFEDEVKHCKEEVGWKGDPNECALLIRYSGRCVDRILAGEVARNEAVLIVEFLSLSPHPKDKLVALTTCLED